MALIFWGRVQARDLNVWPPDQQGISNTNTGSAAVETIMRQARELRRLGQLATNEPLHILLHAGTYQLNRPWFIRPDDSGTEASPTIIEAADGERVMVSGGMQVTNWHKLHGGVMGLPESARKAAWVADVPIVNGRALEFRQLWVNSQKATRARTPNDSLNRLVGWSRTNQEALIATSALGALRDPTGVEMVFHQQWEIAICRLQSLVIDGDVTHLKFCEPESKIQFAHPWPQPVMSTNGNGPFYLANAIEFLDEPGEWFEDVAAGKVYYWPRAHEEMTNARVVAPMLESLVQMEGSLDRSVQYVGFKGIEFANTAWMRPSESGHVPLQAGMYLVEAYKLSPKGTSYHRGLDNQAWIGRAPGAVAVINANHITFEKCRFENLGFSGLDFQSGTHDDVIEGCTFRDVGGNGIQLGKFSDPGIEAHIPYNPADEREISTHERIANNFVTDCGTEDWGCVGICVGYGREINIEHNEVFNLPYTGISLGWGWNKATNCMRDNRVFANHVHNIALRIGDTGGIYTLSPQPGSVIAENSLHDIHLSQYVPDPEHWFYLYADEGSSFITFRDNWCPSEKILKNANGPGNIWTNNGPQVSDDIKSAAGLEPMFQDLLQQ
ncbi:MAG TPA: right-handed parallel beta-helix repeat-containing protein [Verrucomicrobiae bacterium]|nr:right-handed parallel beta-helix repeat-containing protein [Verrucomicrobiae bacterium]